MGSTHNLLPSADRSRYLTLENAAFVCIANARVLLLVPVRVYKNPLRT